MRRPHSIAVPCARLRGPGWPAESLSPCEPESRRRASLDRRRLVSSFSLPASREAAPSSRSELLTQSADVDASRIYCSVTLWRRLDHQDGPLRCPNDQVEVELRALLLRLTRSHRSSFSRPGRPRRAWTGSEIRARRRRRSSSGLSYGGRGPPHLLGDQLGLTVPSLREQVGESDGPIIRPSAVAFLVTGLRSRRKKDPGSCPLRMLLLNVNGEGEGSPVAVRCRGGGAEYHGRRGTHRQNGAAFPERGNFRSRRMISLAAYFHRDAAYVEHALCLVFPSAARWRPFAYLRTLVLCPQRF